MESVLMLEERMTEQEGVIRRMEPQSMLEVEENLWAWKLEGREWLERVRWEQMFLLRSCCRLETDS